jgi:aryl-alcohol dehydrogenase-like predicted oxidoreductase
VRKSFASYEFTAHLLTRHDREGKIKYIGLCEVSSATLRRAVKIAHVDAVQLEYSAFVLDIETPAATDILATCRELGVAVVCYAPLGRGLLTTTFGNNEASDDKNDHREAAFPRFQGENRDANIKLVNQFKAIAEKHGCTTSQLALAWLMKQGDDIFPIPGTKKIKYLEENWGALDVHLTDDEENEIREFVKTAEVAGSRNPGWVSTDLLDTAEES